MEDIKKKKKNGIIFNKNLYNKWIDTILNTHKLEDILLLIKDIEIMEGLKHNEGKFHKETLYEHTKMMLESIEKFKVFDDTYKKQMLRVTVLFHDIGKLFTESIDENGYSHYYGHEVISSHIFREYYRKNHVYFLEDNNKIIGNKNELLPEEDIMSYMIRNHLSFIRMKEDNQKKIIWDLGTYIDVFLTLLLLDKYSRIDPVQETPFEDFKKKIDKIYDMIENSKRSLDRPILWYEDTFEYLTEENICKDIPMRKTTLRNKLIKCIENNTVHTTVLYINMDEMREKGLNIEKEKSKILKEFKEKRSVLILDNTNINRNHWKRNDIYEFLSKPHKYRVIFIDIDHLDLKTRKERRKDFDLDVLVRYDGEYRKPWLDYVVRWNSNVKYFVWKG